MPKQIKARAPQEEREERAVRKLARSHHAPADWIWHARMVVESWAGKTPDQIAQEMQCHPQTVPHPRQFTPVFRVWKCPLPCNSFTDSLQWYTAGLAPE